MTLQNANGQSGRQVNIKNAKSMLKKKNDRMPFEADDRKNWTYQHNRCYLTGKPFCKRQMANVIVHIIHARVRNAD